MIKVVDHTDSATFVLFDRDAAELFKKTCADMIESRGMKNVHEEDVSLVDGVVDGGALKSYIQHYCSGIYRVHSTF
ncbi:hypothetical protein MtrunA17_Chr4g0067391 [Medicago truncatula]|uniref:Nucleic acid-binding protein n=1 Tax=Medicago truncatula TaxID=3880 RepID=A0A396IMY2_MEDTR|nr:hypothetical protein MtrunA17_Chr4g0067391 [Medicago truncatula]